MPPVPTPDNTLRDVDLDPATIRQLTAAAIAAHPGSGRFLALAVSPASPLAGVARTVERRTTAGGFGRYEDDSLFLVVLDRKHERPAAVARVIEGGGRTLDDAPGLIGIDLSAIVAVHDLHTGRIWDVATVAVLPAYRKKAQVKSLLHRMFLNAGRLAGVRHVVAVADAGALRELKLLGVEWMPMAGSDPFPHRGSMGEAVYLHFGDLEPSIARQAGHLRRGGGEIDARGLRRLALRRTFARAAHQISSGEGLDEHIRLPAMDRRRMVRQG